jgi:hypothetical protein
LAFATLVEVDAEHAGPGLSDLDRHRAVAAADLENPFAGPAHRGPEPPPVLLVGFFLPVEVLPRVFFGFGHLDSSGVRDDLMPRDCAIHMVSYDIT